MDTPERRFPDDRRAIMARLFPEGIPRLWCPPLTHFDESGGMDRDRMRAHLRYMQPHVGGFLVPGSTGEGWDLSRAEARELVEFMASEIEAMGAHMLVGALAPTASEMLRSIEETLGWLARRTGTDDVMEMMARSAVRGFAVTPPRGASLAQDEIHAALDRVATSGVPLALYQLPQVTLNEMSAATVAALAARHPTIYLLKDSSGADRIALSGVRDLFLVRGAEGDYAAHLTASGGRYDGFLLSTANCFPRQLSALIVDVARGSRAEADRFSRALTAIMRELLPLAGRIGYGNAFASANKALDHFVAHGLRAAAVPPPRTHGGRRLPRELVAAAGEALGRHGLLPERGYL